MTHPTTDKSANNHLTALAGRSTFSTQDKQTGGSMKSKDLAEFHNVHERTTRKWSQEQRRRKAIQAQADVTPDEWRLIGEIMQLVYLYNAKGWVGASAEHYALIDMNSFHLQVAFNNSIVTKVTFAATDAVAQMQMLKRQLEQLVY